MGKKISDHKFNVIFPKGNCSKYWTNSALHLSPKGKVYLAMNNFSINP